MRGAPAGAQTQNSVELEDRAKTECFLPFRDLQSRLAMITPEQKQLKHYHRWSIYLVRKEGTSRADFNKYWEQTHGDYLAKLNISQKYIVRYDQVSTESCNRVRFTDLET